MREVKNFRITQVLLVTMFIFLFLSLAMLGCKKWFIFTINQTQSLKGHVYVIKKGEPVVKGDLVGFLWQGSVKYPKDAIFVKVVSGVENDHINVIGRNVFINKNLIGKAKEVSSDGKIKLDVIQPKVIGKNEIFVSTPHKDSLDSRYALVGTINKEIILGKAYEIF